MITKAIVHSNSGYLHALQTSENDVSPTLN